MSELISGKEALIALANGEEVEYSVAGKNEWYDKILNITPYYFVGNGVGQFDFRLKPRTITINGIEVPAPFKPKVGDTFWHIYPAHSTGYHAEVMQGTKHDQLYSQFGAWRSEEEIKQVITALRKVLNDS